MSIKVSREQLISMFNTLDKIGNIQKIPFKLSYAISRNKGYMKNEIDAIKEAEKKINTPELLEYDEKRRLLCMEYADKDEKGNPLIVNNAFIVQVRKNEFDSKMNPLNEEYKEVLEKRTKDIEDFNNVFSKEEVEIETYIMNIDLFNDVDGIYSHEVESIMLLLQE